MKREKNQPIFFLKSRKTKTTQSTFKKFEINNREIDNSVKINKQSERFFEDLFERNLEKQSMHTIMFLEIFHYRSEISKKEWILALKSFSNNKSPVSDGLTKEFYETFWEELKQPFMNLLNQIKVSKKLVTFQRQSVIKLLEKKGKDKRLISIWRPISLLNVDYKIIPKLFASTLKKVLLNHISSQQRCMLLKKLR